MKDERWLPVKDFPGYEVSDRGRLRRWLGKGFRLMKTWKSHYGYSQTELYKKGKRHGKMVHRLVLEAFVGKCPKGHQTNHKNGKKQYNFVDNLEWVTPSENVNHAYTTGLKSNVGELCPTVQLKDGEVWLIKKLLFLEVRKKIICKMFKIKYDHLYNISVEKIWTHIVYEPSAADLVTLRKKNYDQKLFY